MGLPPKFSSSSYDSIKYITKIKKVFAPNPDPKKCSIRRYRVVNNFLVVKLNYEGCTTFEGNKILVYKNCSIHDLIKQKKKVGLDPHFCKNKRYHSPIARFEPNWFGWRMAKKLCKLL